MIALTAVCGKSLAQIAGTQYLMNSVPQYVTNNPAFVPKYKFALGLPGSMIDVNYYNNGFNYNDITSVNNGKRVADLSKLTSVLPPKTYITTTAQVDLFRLGLKIGDKAYLSAASSVRGYTRAMIPKDAISLLVNGNSAYVGQTASISPAAETQMFWENSVGLGISLTENLSVGARVKLLRGFMNINTTSANATISVADNYSLTMAADMNVKTSGIHNADDGFKFSNYSGNTGLGVDLGATFKPFDKLTLAASLVDIGAIKWKYNTYQYTLDKSKATYTFQGVDVDKLIEGHSDYGKSLVDSVKTKFKPDEKQGSSYSTALPAKAFVSADYMVVRNFHVGGVIYAERFNGRTFTGMTLGANKHFGKILSTTVSYTLSNRSFNNLGAGLSLNLAPIQIYVVGDNLLRLPLSAIAHQNANDFINSTQVFTLRAGVNFVWGWTDDIRKESYNSKKKNVKTSSDTGKHPTPKSVNARKRKKR
ncbi:MAG: DUF5723 family protein [Bacteroidota bacterium]